jgi:hypothetical protein
MKCKFNESVVLEATELFLGRVDALFEGKAGEISKHKASVSPHPSSYVGLVMGLANRSWCRSMTIFWLHRIYIHYDIALPRSE